MCFLSSSGSKGLNGFRFLGSGFGTRARVSASTYCSSSDEDEDEGFEEEF